MNLPQINCGHRLLGSPRTRQEAPVTKIVTLEAPEKHVLNTAVPSPHAPRRGTGKESAHLELEVDKVKKAGKPEPTLAAGDGAGIKGHTANHMEREQQHLAWRWADFLLRLLNACLSPQAITALFLIKMAVSSQSLRLGK